MYAHHCTITLIRHGINAPIEFTLRAPGSITQGTLPADMAARARKVMGNKLKLVQNAGSVLRSDQVSKLLSAGNTLSVR